MYTNVCPYREQIIFKLYEIDPCNIYFTVKLKWIFFLHVSIHIYTIILWKFIPFHAFKDSISGFIYYLRATSLISGKTLTCNVFAKDSAVFQFPFFSLYSFKRECHWEKLWIHFWLSCVLISKTCIIKPYIKFLTILNYFLAVNNMQGIDKP